MRLGFMTHVDGRGTPAELYRETVELAIAVEQLGFSSFWLTQHHTAPGEGQLPSPLVMLAAIAQRTASIQLGAVIAAPLEDPRRLAEDAAVVDVLSGGRLQLGVGTGSSAAAYERFGCDYANRHDDCARVVDDLRSILRNKSISPQPDGLSRRLWWASGFSSGVDAAAARRMGVISSRPTHSAGASVLDDLARYWARVAGEPRVAISGVFDHAASPSANVANWAADPALEWATDLIVQVPPTPSGPSGRLEIVQTLADRLVATRLAEASRQPRLVPA